MKNFVSPGDMITVTAAADVASGDGVLAGTLFGVAATDAASGAAVEIKTHGVFTLPKTSAQAWTVGAAVYWDADDKVCTTTSTDNTLIGKAVAVADNPSGTGLVRLNG
jgi:predicted RecA/RadA family phage recombinase